MDDLHKFTKIPAALYLIYLGIKVLKRSEIIVIINKKRLKNAFFRNSFLKFKGRSLYFSKRGVLIIRLFLLKLEKLF